MPRSRDMRQASRFFRSRPNRASSPGLASAPESVLRPPPTALARTISSGSEDKQPGEERCRAQATAAAVDERNPGATLERASGLRRFPVADAGWSILTVSSITPAATAKNLLAPSGKSRAYPHHRSNQPAPGSRSRAFGRTAAALHARHLQPYHEPIQRISPSRAAVS